MVGNDIYLFLIKIYTFSTLWLNNSHYIKQQNKNGYHEKVVRKRFLCLLNTNYFINTTSNKNV